MERLERSEQPDPQRTAFALTLRALAYLLSYPDAEWRRHLDDLRELLRASSFIGAQHVAGIESLLVTIGAGDELEAQAAYVELFDRGRGTALHLFEHVHGDSRERGPAMLDLIATYEQAGLALRSDELPDHLTVLLEYASTQPREAAVALLGEVAHIVQRIYSAVDRRGSGYAAVLGALLDIAGERVDTDASPPEPEVDLDVSWQEPAAFDGCGNAGQQAVGRVQPVHVVRRVPADESHAAPNGAEGACA